MEKLPCDVRALRADVAALDALARLQLAARHAGFELRLVQASAELRCLIAFTGLDGVLRVEPQRQAEEREQGHCVEEEGQLDDPAA
jgi:anti-anti-sigma regulatory factor